MSCPIIVSFLNMIEIRKQCIRHPRQAHVVFEDAFADTASAMVEQLARQPPSRLLSFPWSSKETNEWLNPLTAPFIEISAFQESKNKDGGNRAPPSWNFC